MEKVRYFIYFNANIRQIIDEYNKFRLAKLRPHNKKFILGSNEELKKKRIKRRTYFPQAQKKMMPLFASGSIELNMNIRSQVKETGDSKIYFQGYTNLDTQKTIQKQPFRE